MTAAANQLLSRSEFLTVRFWVHCDVPCGYRALRSSRICADFFENFYGNLENDLYFLVSTESVTVILMRDGNFFTEAAVVSGLTSTLSPIKCITDGLRFEIFSCRFWAIKDSFRTIQSDELLK